MKQVPQSGPTNFRLHRTDFFCPGDLAPGIFASLAYVYPVQQAGAAHDVSFSGLLKIVIKD
jgi:hypothetical protein